jgi:hypothetical protein
MTSPDPQATADFVRNHVGHDMKYLAFAAVVFAYPAAEHYQVPLQDSALIRARALLVSTTVEN